MNQNNEFALLSEEETDILNGGSILPYVNNFLVNRLIYTNVINSHNIQQQCQGNMA